MGVAMVTAVVREERDNFSVIVSVNGRTDPTDAEWDAYMEAITQTLAHHKGDLTRIRGISISAGGGPASAQRAKVNQLLSGRTVRVAIITASSVGRGIVTALSWFNPMIRAFSPARLSDAIRYLELPQNTQDALRAQLKSIAVALPEVAQLLQNTNQR
jgi:sugar (pentulose or hexulose) kinase